MDKMIMDTIEAMGMIERSRLLSKVEGRQNYVMRVVTLFHKVYVGTTGKMKEHGLHSVLLMDMPKYGISISEYTYKKDLMEVLDILEKAGYEIHWVK